MKEKILKIRENPFVSYFFPFFVMLLLMLLFAAWTGGRFIMPRNLTLVVNQALAVGLVATGAVVMFSTSRMSAAMGGSTAIACIIGAYAFLTTNSTAAMILGCIGGGIFIMLLAIGLSRLLRMDVMILSIIFMTLLLAVQQWLLDGGKNLSLDYAKMKELQNMNLPLTFCAVFVIVCMILLEFSPFGRKLKLIGSNETCSRQVGINTQRMLAWAFLIAGIGVGLGAAVTLMRSATLSQNTVNSMNMDVMLAVVLGGTPVRGGTNAKVFSGVWGAMTVAILTNGLSMVGIDAVWIQAIRGIFFIAVIALSEKRSDVLA